MTITVYHMLGCAMTSSPIVHQHLRCWLQPQNSGGLPGGVGAASMGLELDTSFAAYSFVSAPSVPHKAAAV